ncbi:hypothetical protein EPIB1_882 [Tritonibacter mobilis]|nr:hypothetical protein EPIB1_882 [Tritonibacter mobilis]
MHCRRPLLRSLWGQSSNVKANDHARSDLFPYHRGKWPRNRHSTVSCGQLRLSGQRT